MNSERIKAVAAIVLLAVAGIMLVRYLTRKPVISEEAFFYDLSERKLFAAARTSVPPIRGLNNPEEDAVRAVVISTNGDASDRRSWTVAYLEKYSPELKQQMQQAQQTGSSPAMGRELSLQHRFVRRLQDGHWFPMSSPEAERIVSEWAVPGPNGITPVVCTP